MNAKEFSKHVLDRSEEWVGEHYPLAEGAEWDRLVAAAAEEIAAIDEQADLDGR
jgi:hypothetical protein